MDTHHIHISGIVQGVGFRPFVYQLAKKYQLHGWVNNTDDGVHIEINGAKDLAEDFYREIISHPPKLAHITQHSFTPTEDREFHRFEIVASSTQAVPSLPLTPDFALCSDCRQEIDDPENRRAGYAFTTCTNCGPRYSIITELPYDRPNTTMALFEQCETCNEEYHNPLNRRHFSQTNSCQVCGIEIYLAGQPLYDLAIIRQAINEGKIIAIKGIGGYLLMCDATNTQAITTLRQRKHRPSKPFAIMYPNLAKIKDDFRVGKAEEAWFTNEVSPILLLEPKEKTSHLAQDVIAPGLNRFGCMIPYAPLFHLLLADLNKPVVATSGNISGSPIIYRNDAAKEELASIADMIITHNRDIVVPQDDSVLSFSSVHQQKIILRRSRGLAPTVLDPGINPGQKNILAVGAHMKSSFAFTHKGLIYVSQYLGDMDNYLTQTYYEQTVDHFFKVFHARPEVIIGDAHPDYFTTTYGRNLASSLKVPFVQIQHHKAHFYAVLAENELLKTGKTILGVIWDGTGYGDDGNIWGGEFFLYQDHHVSRVAHLPYFPFILGNKMPREPRISAMAVSSLAKDYPPGLTSKFTGAEWQTYLQLLPSSNLKTSSMGRLFDAVASLVLDINKTSYEGEAAMQLEAMAANWLRANSIEQTGSYEALAANDLAGFIGQIQQDKNNGVTAGKIAARFHISLVNLIAQEAEKQRVNTVAFSGGVFQNSLLIDLITTLLQDRFTLKFHQRLPANDENIAFGQLAWYCTHETPTP